MSKTFVIAEIGINHNGSLKIAKKLINAAAKAGCNAVKFQKRTVEFVYSEEELDRYRESPWGATNREQKNGLEFNKKEYNTINKYCKEKNIEWFASAWDVESQIFLRQFDLKYNKVASAMLTHRDLLKVIAQEGKYTFISTGMSTMDQIRKAVEIFRFYKCPFELMHCNSTYPMQPEDANLNVMRTLKEEFSCDVGYSGHETGLAVSLAAVALGATSVERHITLDRSIYGSDQAASLEVTGLKRLLANIRAIEVCLGDGVKSVTKSESQIASKLRKINTL